MSYGVGCRRSSDPALLWLWHRLEATAPISPLAWETPYAAGAVQEMAKRQKKIIHTHTHTQVLNDTLDQKNLTDIYKIYRTFHLKATKYTFFSSAYGTFSRIDHILGHRSSLGKFKKTQVKSFLTTRIWD